ncbi:MAG: chorismate-binding protein [Aestuariivita sp.]|nr:chorismate-binding protein [Aestuariivita sp.]MCY4202529.1 chorismate-binding protein [Aestuariivita sp.]MCY4289669.1 chorismate-binding protein [Aestuariivita sp.]MCY4346029.1 chorismate-binding protein [Aestuariivita sp.]
MTQFTTAQRALAAAAVVAKTPLALWRAPSATTFDALAAISAPRLVPVFGATPDPGFVIAPFRTENGNVALLFPADILIRAETLRFRVGNDWSDRPMTDAQAQLLSPVPSGPVQAAAGVQPVAGTPRTNYIARVERTVAAIREGPCEKIVVSRVETRTLSERYDLCDLVEALATAHPHAFIALATSAITGTWLVASPEVLLQLDGDTAHTMALAGTVWPGPDVDIDSFDWPDKIITEQALVSTYIREAFAAEGLIAVEETPARSVRAANLCHLQTDFRYVCADDRALAGLLRRLHPTSAVCGMPRIPALEFILREEGNTRGFYTGYLGPKDLDGATRLFVNLRSARVSGRQISLHVGGGIVAASDPEMEWHETVEKTKTIGQVLPEV